MVANFFNFTLYEHIQYKSIYDILTLILSVIIIYAMEILQFTNKYFFKLHNHFIMLCIL